MKAIMNNYNEIRNERFHGVYPKDYADKLKKKFSQNKAIWYERIIPTSKADELFVSTGGDYSKIWDTYCECCFKNINKNTKELCFVSEDELTWLCKDCYEDIFSNEIIRK